MWKFSCGTDACVFYHPALDMHIELMRQYDFSIEYQLGKNMPCRKIQYDLAITTSSPSPYYEGFTLLSQLRSGKGASVDGITCFGVWSFINDGPTIVFTSKDRPSDRLVLTNEGFIFFCPGGAVVAGHETETCTTAARAQAVLDKARACQEPPTTLPRQKNKVMCPLQTNRDNVALVRPEI